MKVEEHDYTEFRKVDSQTYIEIWRFEFEDGTVDYQKNCHVHGDSYYRFREEIDKDEHDRLLKKLVTDDEWHEVEG